MSNEKIKPEMFRSDAKHMVDALFDAKCMREDITRDQLNVTEDALSDLMQMRFDAHLRAVELLKKMEHLTKKS